MAINLDKGSLAINQVITNRRWQESVQGDCIVPDIKPDILEVVGTSGTLNIYKREVMDGKVRIDGCVNIYVMYIGEDDSTRGVRSINHTLDFSQVFNIDEATCDMNESGEIVLQNIECKIVNERKISLRANIDFEIKLLANSNIEYVNNIDIRDVQKLENTIQVNQLLSTGFTKTITKETVNIDQSDNLAEILKVNTDICNKSIKVSYNKILTKADIKLKIMYLTEDNRIRVINNKFPIMGFVDMPDIKEDNNCDYDFEIKNMVIKPNNAQEHSIYIEIETGINVAAYERREINVIQDLYSPSTALRFEQREVRVIQNKQSFTGSLNINQKELLDIGDEKVYDADCAVLPNEIKVSNNEVYVGGNVSVTFIHSVNSMTGMQTKTVEIPFETRLKCLGVDNNSNVEVASSIASEDFNIMPGGEINININADFTVKSSNDTNIHLISNVDEQENEENFDYNMVIYTAKAGDSLWNIAKEFRSTMKSIMETNDLKDQSIMPGTKLFIEKYMG